MKFISIHDGHNAGVAYMQDGEILFAIQEERLTKIKNAGGFPYLSLEEILIRNKIDLNDIDAFLFVGNTSSYKMVSRKEVMEKYNRLMSLNKNEINSSSVLFRSFLKKFIPRYFVNMARDKKMEREKKIRIQPVLKMGVPEKKIKFIEHHTCHAATSAYGWGRDEKITVVTADGSGDNISGSINIFNGTELERKAVIDINDSIARLYSLITYYMGMVPNEHEYKIMGMAPYAENSKPARELADYFHSLFEYNDDGLTYKRKRGIEPIFQFGPRLKEILAYKRFDYISAGIQLFTEEFITGWVKRIMRTIKVNKIAIGGGLFMNVKLNKRILELDEVNEMFVFPSCGDESNVFGALYYYWYKTAGKKPNPITHYYFGGDFDERLVETAIKNYKFKNCKISFKETNYIEKEVAELIANNQVVARFKGKMEFGARALGNRSILANAANPFIVKTINKMIKSRDFWMPFAPSLIKLEDYVTNPKKIKAPYMILTFNTKPQKIKTIFSAIHPYDNTCRPHEVYNEWNPGYFAIIKEYEKITGENAILNTSFNLHGYPIVYTPEDALFVFDNSDLKYLALENFLIQKIK